MAASARSLWLSRLQHDLVKRVLWTARDYRDAGQTPPRGGLITQCINDEGLPIAAAECWKNLKAEAPPQIELGEFERALARSLAAAEADDVDGVLMLEAAFERLRRSST